MIVSMFLFSVSFILEINIFLNEIFFLLQESKDDPADSDVRPSLYFS